MPKWVVRCPNCGDTFTHTQIDAAVVDEGFRDPFHIILKPTMPPDGDKRTCPRCNTESQFQSHNLLYCEDSSGTVTS
jgi:endogenous inhibitor of DNA gyrase (YacG/DUF329 family)